MARLFGAPSPADGCNPVNVLIGSNRYSIYKTVDTTGMGITSCPNPCGPSCRTNTDFPGHPDEFEVTVTPGQISVVRLDSNIGWWMQAEIPCCTGPGGGARRGLWRCTPPTGNKAVGQACAGAPPPHFAISGMTFRSAPTASVRPAPSGLPRAGGGWGGGALTCAPPPPRTHSPVPMDNDKEQPVWALLDCVFGSLRQGSQK